MNLVTLERLSWLPAGRPMKAHSAGEMSVGTWKMDTRAGLPSSPSTGALRRRRLSASFCTFAAFFSRRLASEISSDTVSRTASRRAVMDFASASRRTSSGTAAAVASAATGVAVTAAATGVAATAGVAAAEAVAFAAFLGAAAAAAEAVAGFAAEAVAATTAGAATATSSVFFVTFFAAAVFVAEAVAAFIIPWAEEETEDILRRTYC